MTRLGLTFAVAIIVTATAMPADARSRSDTGRRGISGAVEYSPVDSLGPTLSPDNSLTPNSGWNGSAGGLLGVAGPNYNTSPPLIAPPPPPKRGYIILNQGN